MNEKINEQLRIMNNKGLTREFVLGILSEGPARFMPIWANNQALIDGMISDGLIDIQHGARRRDDLLVITDAGREASK